MQIPCLQKTFLDIFSTFLLQSIIIVENDRPVNNADVDILDRSQLTFGFLLIKNGGEKCIFIIKILGIADADLHAGLQIDLDFLRILHIDLGYARINIIFHLADDINTGLDLVAGEFIAGHDAGGDIPDTGDQGIIEATDAIFAGKNGQIGRQGQKSLAGDHHGQRLPLRDGDDELVGQKAPHLGLLYIAVKLQPILGPLGLIGKDADTLLQTGQLDQMASIRILVAAHLNFPGVEEGRVNEKITARQT